MTTNDSKNKREEFEHLARLTPYFHAFTSKALSLDFSYHDSPLELIMFVLDRLKSKKIEWKSVNVLYYIGETAIGLYELKLNFGDSAISYYNGKILNNFPFRPRTLDEANQLCQKHYDDIYYKMLGLED